MSIYSLYCASNFTYSKTDQLCNMYFTLFIIITLYFSSLVSCQCNCNDFVPQPIPSSFLSLVPSLYCRIYGLTPLLLFFLPSLPSSPSPFLLPLSFPPTLTPTIPLSLSSLPLLLFFLPSLPSSPSPFLLPLSFPPTPTPTISLSPSFSLSLYSFFPFFLPPPLPPSSSSLPRPSPSR